MRVLPANEDDKNHTTLDIPKYDKFPWYTDLKPRKNIKWMSKDDTKTYLSFFLIDRRMLDRALLP